MVSDDRETPFASTPTAAPGPIREDADRDVFIPTADDDDDSISTSLCADVYRVRDMN